MRVKIQGQITAERLAAALEAVQARFDEVEEGFRFFGANLYLTAYAADGRPMDLVDHKGDTLMITIGVPSGELARPALTGAALERQEKAKADAAKAKAEEKAAQAEYWRKQNEEMEERRRQAEEREAAYQAYNTLTAQLLARIPERFIAGMNDIVHAVWAEMKPVEINGKKKGQPKPVPYFEIQGETLLLNADNWKAPRKALNPFGTRHRFEIIKPYWAHDAWQEAIRRILDMMSALVDELNTKEVDTPEAAQAEVAASTID